MGFLGIGGLEFLLIFAVAMFFLGPKRLAEGVKAGRKYYTELRRYRNEMTSLVKEAIDADDLKKEFEETKREVWDEGAKADIEGVQKEFVLDKTDLEIPELDITRPVPTENLTSRPRSEDRGDGKVDGEYVPSISVKVVEAAEQVEPAAEESAEAAKSDDVEKSTA